MNVLQRRYRAWKHGRKFVRAGKGCRFQGRFLEVDGHVEVGGRVKIRDHVILRTHGMGRILIGDRTGLSYFCMIEATRCIRIGCFTGIAEFTVIRDTNHLVFGTAEHWRLTPHIADPIVIGDACMITSRCYIGPGVAIGDGAVVAPGSVVTKDIPPFEVWGGNPARKIGHRTQGPMAEAMRRRYAELIEAAGVQATEHRAALEAMEAVAEQGINRAAQERDRLRAEFAASPAAGGGGLDD
ncbi:MAG TPA: acyltransferase [Candidatus Hydrogenedentes bacterium]|nr:acyltransferase [Candidatus Hydrogenedentota bacterium]HNT86474.1 acyltransferase [Candidatus Hydrogenedentota bacterium]